MDDYIGNLIPPPGIEVWNLYSEFWKIHAVILEGWNQNM